MDEETATFLFMGFILENAKLRAKSLLTSEKDGTSTSTTAVTSYNLVSRFYVVASGVWQG